MTAKRLAPWMCRMFAFVGATLLFPSQAMQANSSLSLEETHSLLRGTQVSQNIQRSEASMMMSPDYIEALATRTTVVIAQEIDRGITDPGSGAIVAKVGNLYFAVTNLHVVPYVNATYGIRTFDGEIHVQTRRDRYFEIYRFGEQMDDETVRGLDIAIIAFQSDRDYPVAGVNLRDAVNPGDTAFVSGWPLIPGEQNMDRLFSSGQIVSVAPPSLDGGYGLFYTSQTLTGMSGGPVFNNRGEVIGIHGRGSEAQTQGANQGILATSVAERAADAKRTSQLLNRLNFVTRSPDVSVITDWVRSPRLGSASTFIDPVNAFRTAFLDSALRDCSPSRVDTGNPEDQCN